MPKTAFRDAARDFLAAARDLVHAFREEARTAVRGAAGRASRWADSKKRAVLRAEKDLMRRVRGTKTAKKKRAAARRKAPRAKPRTSQRGRRAASR